MKQQALQLALVTGLILSACSRPDQKAEAPAPPPEPNTVTLIASDFKYSGPDTIPAGVTTFRMVNNGQEPHHVFVVKLNEGKTVQDFSAAMKPGAPWPSWAVMIGGPNAAVPGDTIAATLSVDNGNYALFCLIPGSDGVPHVAKGMMRALTVIPANGPTAAEPTADLTMSLVDYGFNLSAPLTAGRHTIRMENPSTQPHEVLIVKLEPGKTVQDFLAYTEKMEGPIPGRPVNGISGMAPGTHAFITNDFTPGDYGLICFVSDAKDGKPHFLHGMIQQITVS